MARCKIRQTSFNDLDREQLGEELGIPFEIVSDLVNTIIQHLKDEEISLFNPHYFGNYLLNKKC